jgi:hypothetical protein
MTPARRYGPAGVHRAPAPEPIAYADLCSPADTYRTVLALLAAGFTDAAHAILLSGERSHYRHCGQAAREIERHPPATSAAAAIVRAALAASQESHA